MPESLISMFDRLDLPADALSDVLRTVQAGSGITSLLQVEAPWAVEADETRHRAGFHVISEGRCWALPAGGAPIRLHQGDLIVFPHGAGHVLADHPDTPPVPFAAFFDSAAVQAPSASTPEQTVVLCGAYRFKPSSSHPLLLQLPDILHLRAEEQGADLKILVQLLVAETRERRLGSSLAGDLLVDLLFLYGLRTWLTLQEGKIEHSWLHAIGDRSIGVAIGAIHRDPATRWSVAELARLGGVSRAAFASRFTRAVGEPPLAYITRWRMILAHQFLQSGASVAEAAKRVGYENEFAFAKAFKRQSGSTPGSIRKRSAGQLPVRTTS